MVDYHKPVLDFLCKSLGTEFIRSYSDEDIKSNSGFFIEIFKAQICLKKASLYNVADHKLSITIQSEIKKLEEYCSLLRDGNPELVKENIQATEERKPITAEMVRELREISGVTLMECKKALTSVNGDQAEALNLLCKTNFARI